MVSFGRALEFATLLESDRIAITKKARLIR
jgi:hypothetical protein